MVCSPTQIPYCDSHSPATFDLFLSFDAEIHFTVAFPPLRNSDHVVISVSIYFFFWLQIECSFHSTTSDYVHAVWDDLLVYLRDVP